MTKDGRRDPPMEQSLVRLHATECYRPQHHRMQRLRPHEHPETSSAFRRVWRQKRYVALFAVPLKNPRCEVLRVEAALSLLVRRDRQFGRCHYIDDSLRYRATRGLAAQVCRTGLESLENTIKDLASRLRCQAQFMVEGSFIATPL